MSENGNLEKDKVTAGRYISPAHLDKMVSVIEIKSWVAFATVLIIIGAALIWGFFGTMQLREDVKGALVRSGKVFHIYATDDSILLDFTLRPEQRITRDQVVARIEQLGLVREINLLIDQNAPNMEIEAKREELITRSQIRTPDFGRVVDVYVRSGDYVKKGEKLATISKEAPDNKILECYLFMPASQVKNMKAGMRVNVYPARISKKTYGNMIGTIAFISDHPVTYNYLFNILGSEELAKDFLQGGAMYEVYVYLAASEETVTGYQWTMSLGPKKKFADLTLCDASIVIEELRPIDVFFFGN